MFLLLAVHVLIASATRDRWSALWLAPLGAAAYYVRYGSIAALGCLAIVFVCVWRDQLHRLLFPLVVTGLLFAALLIPHFLDSIEKTGSPTRRESRDQRTHALVAVFDGAHEPHHVAGQTVRIELDGIGMTQEVTEPA